MRIAVLSDIHSNFHALSAVIADAEKRSPDWWIFLGDYITDCPYPHRTVEFLRDFAETHPCVLIRGNREDYMINQRKSPQPWEYGSKTGALPLSPAPLSAGKGAGSGPLAASGRTGSAVGSGGSGHAPDM